MTEPNQSMDGAAARMRTHQMISIREVLNRPQDINPYEKGLLTGCAARLQRAEDLTENQVKSINQTRQRLGLTRMSSMKTRRNAVPLVQQVEQAIRARIFPGDVLPEMKQALIRLHEGKPMTARQSGLWGGYKPQLAKYEAR